MLLLTHIILEIIRKAPSFFNMQNIKQIKLQELLKQLRVDANLRQIDLAEKLNKPQSYVSKYESGEKILDFVEVNDICLALNIKLSSFSNQYESSLNDCE